MTGTHVVMTAHAAGGGVAAAGGRVATGQSRSVASQHPEDAVIQDDAGAQCA